MQRCGPESGLRTLMKIRCIKSNAEMKREKVRRTMTVHLEPRSDLGQTAGRLPSS